jgi:hypothetical protein
LAKVINPLNSSEARGRIGGLIYNTWRGIRTVRTYTPPAHESDPLRQAHKNIVQAAGQRWSTISFQQRAAWAHFANAHPDIDWTGTPKRIAGYHWYVRIQTRLIDSGGTYIDDPPTDFVDRSLDGPFAYYYASNINLTWMYEPAHPHWSAYYDTWIAGPFTAGKTPSIKDAKRVVIIPTHSTPYVLGPFSTGWWTVFMRPMLPSGMVGTWYRSAPVEVP